MEKLETAELKSINGGWDLGRMAATSAVVVEVANEVYDFCRGYNDASEGRYDP